MPREIDPIVGNWYAHLDKGQRFTVTALNEEDATVELQHFDGDIEELSLNDWYDLDIELSDEPENWSGAMDIAEIDDFGTEVTDTSRDDWSAPLTEFRDPEAEKLTATPEEPEDEWAEGFIKEEQIETEK
ncbi:MAG: hypothetical protein L0Z73_09440 [Gammaproteobacteria bacterium]|nr:hypothetical protein [Gammaproteobacteria bacterium]